MRDYYLSKLFFDLQTPAAGAAYRADRAKVLARYPLKPEVLAAIAADDVAALAPLVNAYLLRFYFLVIDMPEEEFVKRVRNTGNTGNTGATSKAPHG